MSLPAEQGVSNLFFYSLRAWGKEEEGEEDIVAIARYGRRRCFGISTTQISRPGALQDASIRSANV